jgi:hypothetical protein
MFGCSYSCGSGSAMHTEVSSVGSRCVIIAFLADVSILHKFHTSVSE